MAKYSDATLRGMLLEEAILFILSKTGYKPVVASNGDLTLNDGSSGLEVRGRGAKIAEDFLAKFKEATDEVEVRVRPKHDPDFGVGRCDKDGRKNKAPKTPLGGRKN